MCLKEGFCRKKKKSAALKGIKSSSPLEFLNLSVGNDSSQAKSVNWFVFDWFQAAAGQGQVFLISSTIKMQCVTFGVCTFFRFRLRIIKPYGGANDWWSALYIFDPCIVLSCTPAYLLSRFAITPVGSRFAIFTLVNTWKSSERSEFKPATSISICPGVWGWSRGSTR